MQAIEGQGALGEEDRRRDLQLRTRWRRDLSESYEEGIGEEPKVHDVQSFHIENIAAD